MPLAQLRCPGCQQAVQVDTDKLPDQPAALQCPAPECGTRMTVEKSRLLAQLGQAAAPAPAGSAPGEAPVPGPAAPAAPESAPSKSADGFERPIIAVDNPPTSSAPADLLPPGYKLPTDCTFPSGVVVAEDTEGCARLIAALEPHGVELAELESLDRLGQYDVLPELIVWVEGGGKDAMATLNPLHVLPPAKRRGTFIVMVADSIASLDGQQAFRHQIDLVINKADIEQSAPILRLALDAHDRLTGPMITAERERKAG